MNVTAKRRPRTLMLAVASMLLLAPLAQATTTVRGSVLLPFGTAMQAERLQFAASGCAETDDTRNGAFGAYFNVTGFSKVRIKVDGADLTTPGANPSADGRLWGSCDPTDRAFAEDCRAFLENSATCTMDVKGARYLEVAFTTNAFAWAGVNVTITKIS
ncbi:MAG TPA: hypothetical protein VGB83_05035 [Actinomycetota bacterium]